MEITVGRIVLYTLTEEDAAEINRRRTSGPAIADRIKNNGAILIGGNDVKLPDMWPLGAQAHIGNTVEAGEVYPLIVTRLCSPGVVNGQVLLDGNDAFWAKSCAEGTEPGTWAWPPRV